MNKDEKIRLLPDYTFFPDETENKSIAGYSALDLADLIQTYPNLTLQVLHEVRRTRGLKIMFDTLYNLDSFNVNAVEILAYVNNESIVRALALLREDGMIGTSEQKGELLRGFYSQLLTFAALSVGLHGAESEDYLKTVEDLNTINVDDIDYVPLLSDGRQAFVELMTWLTMEEVSLYQKPEDSQLVYIL